MELFLNRFIIPQDTNNSLTRYGDKMRSFPVGFKPWNLTTQVTAQIEAELLDNIIVECKFPFGDIDPH